MDLDDQLRRYFGTDDLGNMPAHAFAAGLEHMRVDLGLETDHSRRFGLWTLMHALGAEPDFDVAFEDPVDRDAARHWMELSERMTPEE